MYRTLQISNTGLTESDILRLRTIHGWNELPVKKESVFRLLLDQFRDVMVYVLLGAALVSVGVPYIQQGHIERGELINATVILAIVLLNALLGFVQEWKAGNAIEMLRKLSAPKVKVRRDGVVQIIPSRELLPSDIMLLEAGDRVSGDGRIAASSSLEVDEASLTGESVPASKKVEETLSAGSTTPGMVYSSTLVTRGYGEIIVTSIALNTEIGKITSMVSSLHPPPTPLSLQLQVLGKRIGVIVLILCAVIFAAGVAGGMAVKDIFFTAVSLAVAAVPEGLPTIVTICLAMGVQRMIKRNALVRRLDAVETLGSVTVICADKTGTITMNRMTVEKIWTPDGIDTPLALEIAASCNRAELPDIGDPTEVALLKRAEDHGVQRLGIVDEEVPFTSESKYMVTVHEKNGQKVRYIKGAPEVVARFFDDAPRREVLKRSAEMSEQGLRVLAVAEDLGNGIVSAGLIALIDPPRPDVKTAIANARKAGIRTIMITGDHPATALAIGMTVGIETEGVVDGASLEEMDQEALQECLKKTSVFARVAPVHKVKILEALQALGHIVAMSGDGVNDAPALKRAHVGIAMGLNGTDVAREAGAMVLTDDNYSTIVAAVEEGRRIYDNIRKFVVFLMRSNFGEVLIISTAVLFRMPLPLLPLHILWINLVTDSFPALALAMEEGEEGIMARPPRKQSEGIFYGQWTLLIVAGVLNAALALGLFVFVMRTNGDLALARTVALTSTIVYQLLLAISTRTRTSVFSRAAFKSPWLFAAIGVSLGLHALLLMTPLNILFSVVPIPLVLIEETLGAAIVFFLIFEGAKVVVNRKF